VKYLSKRKLNGRAVNRTTHPRCSVKKFCMVYLKEAINNSVLNYKLRKKMIQVKLEKKP
jgi:hypothetical protein